MEGGGGSREKGDKGGWVTQIIKIILKVVVCAEILPRDFLQTPGNYYL